MSKPPLSFHKDTGHDKKRKGQKETSLLHQKVPALLLPQIQCLMVTQNHLGDGLRSDSNGDLRDLRILHKYETKMQKPLFTEKKGVIWELWVLPRSLQLSLVFILSPVPWLITPYSDNLPDVFRFCTGIWKHARRLTGKKSECLWGPLLCNHLFSYYYQWLTSNSGEKTGKHQTIEFKHRSQCNCFWCLNCFKSLFNPIPQACMSPNSLVAMIME